MAHAPDLLAARPGQRLLEVARQRDTEQPLRAVLASLAGTGGPGGTWRAGARGEAMVAARLYRLRSGRRGDRWLVLHGVVLPGGGDVDHLVAGPSGIFTLNTKFHPGRAVSVEAGEVVVDGRPTRYAAQARREAARVAVLLGRARTRPVRVVPLVVVVAAHLSVHRQPPGVVVLGWRGVARWIRRRGPVPGHETLPADVVVAALAAGPSHRVEGGR